ncbi:MAG: hypothetical protein ACYC0T_11425 [Ramlibacter sp.]
MPVFASSPEFDELRKQFEAAQQQEGQAIRNLHRMLEESLSDRAVLREAVSQMEAIHNRKMDIYALMLTHRIDR